VKLPPLISGLVRTREVFVTNEVQASVYPPWQESFDGIRLSRFRGTLDAFTTNERVSIACKPFDKPGSAFIAPTHPVAADVWDIRSIDPRPGIRCFGCFGGKDLFVALTWDYRENLESSDDWAAEVAGCRAAWTALFDPIQPFRGKCPDEYLSNHYLVRSNR
jgi:hypothetical protein